MNQVIEERNKYIDLQQAEIAQLTKERDELKAELGHTEEANIDLSKTCARLRDDRDTLTARLATVEACCAEMREIIPELWRCANDDCDLSDADIQHALSTDCGKGILERVNRLEEALKECSNIAPLTLARLASLDSSRPFTLDLQRVRDEINKIAKLALEETAQ